MPRPGCLMQPGRFHKTAMRNRLSASLLVLLLVSGSFAFAADSQRLPHIVAHRGLSRHAPENTLAGFRSCLDLRLGFELDVRRAADGELVCVHDATVDRTTNGRGQVTELTVAQLKTLDAGTWFDPAFRGEQIPTIDEIFSLLARYANSPALIAVDMKGDDARIEQDVVALAARHKVLDRLLFIGRTIERPEVRQRLKAASPAVRVAKLVDAAQFIASARDAAVDVLYVRFIPDSEQMAAAHRANKQVFLAGPLVAGRETENWERARQAGLDAVLTDFPLEMRQRWRARAASAAN